MTERFYSPVIKYTTSNLTSLPGALLYFYETGTSTPKTTWTDPERATASAHPVVALSDGTFPPIFINGVYRVELKNAAGVTQPGWPVDDVGSPAAGFPFQSWSSTYSYSEDDLVTYGGEFYQSLADANVGNTPSTSPAFWQKKLFLDAPTAESYLNGNSDGTYTWRTIAQTKTDLSLPTDTVSELALKAPLASPTFTGNPTAPTPPENDNDTSIATTAYVQTELLDRVQTVASIAELTALTGMADDQKFNVTGYFAGSTKGGGDFVWDASSTATENLITIFESDAGGTGRFIRINYEVMRFEYAGCLCDGTDETTKVQALIDAFPSGIAVQFKGNLRVGGISVPQKYVHIMGETEADTLTVNSGTVGVTFNDHWCGFSNLTIISQGTMGDGLGTAGALWNDTAPIGSLGFNFLYNVNIKNFSGYGVRCINSISMLYQRGYVLSCTIGVDLNRDAGAVSFGTTAHLSGIYFSSCTTALKMRYQYRTIIDGACVFEDGGVGIDASACAFTVFRCYFESNTTAGMNAADCEVEELYNYQNAPTGGDIFNITFTGATAAADRGSVRANKYDFEAKRLGIQSQYGVDPLYLASHGTTSNTGLKYGNNTVALNRGENLLNNSSWVSNRLAEFSGYSSANQGYRISGTTAGDNTYGIKQDVTMDTSKTYVLDVSSTTVSGSGITLYRCGATAITPGVPFSPPSTGANTVKAYGTDAGGTPFECYINAITLAEVVVDFNQVANSNRVLTSKRPEREKIYAAAAPASGSWAVGEIVWNNAPAASGFIGWVCTTAGTPGTWKTWGVISA